KSISRLTARVSRFNPQARSEIGSGFRLATRRSRTLSAESTLNISLTFSKATVISGAIGSRRSSLRACARARRKNPSTPSVVTRTLVLFFILTSPKTSNFVLKLLCKRFIIAKFYDFGLAHVVSMMLIVAVVVAQYTAIVHRANPRIDVSQAVLHNFVAYVPNFFFENCSPPRARQITTLIHPLVRFRGPFSALHAHSSCYHR